MTRSQCALILLLTYVWQAGFESVKCLLWVSSKNIHIKWLISSPVPGHFLSWAIRKYLRPPRPPKQGSLWAHHGQSLHSALSSNPRCPVAEVQCACSSFPRQERELSVCCWGCQGRHGCHPHVPVCRGGGVLGWAGALLPGGPRWSDARDRASCWCSSLSRTVYLAHPGLRKPQGSAFPI